MFNVVMYIDIKVIIVHCFLNFSPNDYFYNHWHNGKYVYRCDDLRRYNFLDLASWPIKKRNKYMRNPLINPLQPGVAFLYLLKTSENLQVFWWFQGYRKVTPGCNGLTFKTFYMVSLKGNLNLWFSENILEQHPGFCPLGWSFSHFWAIQKS